MDIENTDFAKRESVFIICIKYFAILVFGSFCLATYPQAVNLVGFLGITLILWHSMRSGDHFSFLILLYFSNHFVFGNDKGGLFNLAALAAFLVYNATTKHTFFKQRSTFGSTTALFVTVLLCCQLLSLVANNKAAIGSKISCFLIFTALIILVYQLSKIKVEESDFVRFIKVLFVYTGYSLVTALNQKYVFIPFDSQLLPRWKDVDFQFDVYRCGGTLINFEAYAEYSLSVIVLLLPGILSGSIKQKSLQLYFISIAIVFMSFLGIILSVTRSSFFLLPIAIVFIVFNQIGRIKLNSVFPFILALTLGLIVNSFYTIIDISSFVERSKEMQVKKVSDITSGSEINRGAIFDFAFKKIARSNGVIGEGYFTNPADYRTVHFDVPDPPIGDYHNLYLGISVFWGYFGAVSFIVILILPIVNGFTAYKRYKKTASFFQLDLLLGFTTLFIFFIINQYKIIFLREANYAVIFFILLVLYNALIALIKRENTMHTESLD